MSLNNLLIYGGGLLLLGAGIYIMYQEGFLDDIFDKLPTTNLSFHGSSTTTPSSYDAYDAYDDNYNY